MRNDAVLDEIFIFKHAKTPFFSVIILLASMLSKSTVQAQNPQWNAAEIKLNLEKLNVFRLCPVLCSTSG
jgi:hypothetical protein